MADSGVVGSLRSNMAEIWVRDEDDWSGISDARERRKIQNRRNQRKHRSKGPSALNAVSSNRQAIPASAVTIHPPTQHSLLVAQIETIANAIRSVNILDTDSEQNQIILRNFEHFANQYYAARKPEITLLPSLSQFNFIRSLLANVKVLGLSSSQMDDEALSPFNLLSPQPNTSRAIISRLPPGLQPTDLQISHHHHPWLDLLPVPEMRDNLFRRGLDCFDEDELCHALRGRIPGHNPGVLVWSDPWDPSGWEVTEAFVKEWGWVLVGCHDLFRSTNRWRAQRGEKPLFRLPSHDRPCGSPTTE